MSRENHTVIALYFRKVSDTAVIVTDGKFYLSRESEQLAEHATLSKAISYLEAKGYDIDIENFNVE